MTIIANRYEVLEKLGSGGMGAVYLVHDKLRNQKVALKQVLMSDDEQRLAITREFRTLSTLRHPNIVSVIEYGSHENQPYFTMDYLPQAVPFDKSVDRRIEPFIQMLQAIGYLHRRGILHRDLKPANVLVTADGVVKVLDFGLARDTVKGKNEAEEGVVGTLAYMAPEILNEDPPSVGSDLWAVGVMLCEMLTGNYPFDATSPIKLMVSVMREAPNLTGLDEEFIEVVLRLLSRDTAERYPSALATIHALCAAAKIELPPESQAQRESFLQAAAFVGREHEYQCLVDALKITMGGTGQLWLIGGEAGAGKSRLLDELRTQALVDGLIVLQGQGVEGGGLPYQLWRDPARKLVLGAPMSDLTASVLKELVPDIATLLDRHVADIPTLEADSHRDRLMAALLERLKALATPLLIILEDLHWTNESLTLLKMFLPHFDSMPVMVVGSYRNEERPDLPQAFPTANLLVMERLTPEAVAALSASMIGAENTTPELIQRLAKETEGNVLFMVEVMRALAEDAGSLEGISHRFMPTKILAGGMMAVLKRRLERVPSWALETLKLAAVIGRIVNIPVMQAASVANIEGWLQACADSAVLEPYQGEWRFSHDRLREVLLHNLTDLALLHEKAALALESVYPNDGSYAETLMEHWRIAGNSEREMVYILQAAEYMLNATGDYLRAGTLVERGLDLNQPDTRAELLRLLGEIKQRQVRYAEAVSLFQQGLSAAPTPITEILLLCNLAWIFRIEGKFNEARDYALRAQSLSEAIHYPQGVAKSLSILGSVSIMEANFEAAHTYFKDCLQIYHELGDHLAAAINLGNLGTVAFFQKDNQAALSYQEEALSLKRALGNRFSIAGSLPNLGLATLQQGDFQAAKGYFEEGLSLAHEIRHQEMVIYSAGGLVIVFSSSGKLDAAASALSDALKTAAETDSLQLMVIALFAAVFWALAQQQFERIALWIGLILRWDSGYARQYPQFDSIAAQVRIMMGDEAFNAAVERGKILDVRTVIDDLLQELTGS